MNLLPQQTVFSVTQLNHHVKSLLEQQFFAIEILGEISNLSRPASGHVYFSLKDDRAQIRCALFKRQADKLDFIPKNGLEIQASANVSLYEARGDYQLIINKMQETGDGALRQAYEKLKEKLTAQGLFSHEHKKTMPLIPKTIGVITSPSGAAIRDILSVLARRFPSIPVIIYPVLVQGNEAKYAINQAITTANKRKDCDILILARGGGSIEDLWAFNEEMVAKAIFKSRLPIMTGIGHETDTTIADYVADLRTATPTAAAEHCTPDARQWLNEFQTYEHQLKQLIHAKIQHNHQQLDWFTKQLHQQHPEKKLYLNAQRLKELELRLKISIKNKLSQTNARLKMQHAQLWQFNPKYKVQQFKERYLHLNAQLHTSVQVKLQARQKKLTYLSQALNIVSPLATLDRGYTISTDEQNTPLYSSKQLTLGQHIKTRLKSGEVISQIQDINHEEVLTPPTL